MTGPVTRAATDRVRDPYWDNLRFIAIALVVVGHLAEDFTSSTTMTALHFVIYAFHMPLFAFISGYFAKAGPLTAGTAFATVRQLVAPYVLFSVIWFGLRRTVEGSGRLDFGSPYSLMWFLLALAVWRAALPYLASLRYPVLISFVISVGAGYLGSVGSTFDSGKIFGMLPFFVLGWAARERRWVTPPVIGRLTARPVRLGAVVVLAGVLALAYANVGAIRDLRLRQWARMTVDYVDLGAPEWWAGLVRIGLFALTLLLGACLLSLAPRGASVMTAWGSRTMYVYLLHLIPVYFVREATTALAWFNTVPRLLAVVALAVLWAALLSTRPVQRVFRPVVEPRLDWLRARPAGHPAAAGSLDGAAAGRVETR